MPLQTSPEPGVELARLTDLVSKWGMEAGFLGIEDEFEPRMLAAVQASTLSAFGDAGAELKWLRSELTAIESERDEAAAVVSSYRAAIGCREQGSWISRVRAWLWDFRAFRAARRRLIRCQPALQKVRTDLELAQQRAEDTQRWRELAVESLKANYGFQKARAAAVRP